MRIVTEDEAQRILEPHIPALIECWNRAWANWLLIGQTMPGVAVAIRSRAQAATIYDLMVHELKHWFDSVPGVTWSEKGGFLTLVFDDVLMLRFKKFDQNLRSHNIMTRQQVLFQLQMVLPGFPEITRAVLGYQLDKMQATFENLVVACRTGDKLEWALPLTESGAGSAGIGVMPIPMQPDMPKPQIGRIKTAEEKAREEADKQAAKETGDL